MHANRYFVLQTATKPLQIVTWLLLTDYRNLRTFNMLDSRMLRAS